MLQAHVLGDEAIFAWCIAPCLTVREHYTCWRLVRRAARRVNRFAPRDEIWHAAKTGADLHPRLVRHLTSRAHSCASPNRLLGGVYVVCSCLEACTALQSARLDLRRGELPPLVRPVIELRAPATRLQLHVPHSLPALRLQRHVTHLCTVGHLSGLWAPGLTHWCLEHLLAPGLWRDLWSMNRGCFPNLTHLSVLLRLGNEAHLTYFVREALVQLPTLRTLLLVVWREEYDVWPEDYSASWLRFAVGRHAGEPRCHVAVYARKLPFVPVATTSPFTLAFRDIPWEMQPGDELLTLVP